MKKIFSKKTPADLKTKRKLSIFYNKAIFISKLLVIGIFGALIFFRQFTGLFSNIGPKLSETLGEYGFALENVGISGQKNTLSSEIVEALNADIGTPIFSVDLDKSLVAISKKPWVKNVVLERKLPNTIIVNLEEREPIALYQFNKEIFVIDRDGEKISNISTDKFANFILVVGEGANIYASELVDELSANPSLAGKVVNAIRYGQRRWDLTLSENITVKMPQSDFQKAYKYLAKLNEEGKLFGNKVKIVDLRDSEKAYIEKIK